MTAAWTFNDGGRAAAGFKGDAGDCVTRSIAIATGLDYRFVYDGLWDGLREYGDSHRDEAARRIQRGGGRRGTTPRNGVSKKVFKVFLDSLGWVWHPTMTVGSGCTTHLRADELPAGRIICSVSKHMVAVINGVIQDTYDCSRDGTRCVYGYWTAPAT